MGSDPGDEERFRVYPGVPEIRDRWDELVEGGRQGTLSGEERTLLERWAKAIRWLRRDPSHQGLRTHEIDALTRRYGRTVFQSYLGQGEQARRMYWAYGPGRRKIPIIGLESHPEESAGAYERIPLPRLPDRKSGDS